MRTDCQTMLKKLLDYLQLVISIFLDSWDRIAVCMLSAAIISGGFWYSYRSISAEEAAARIHLVRTAQTYLGYNEADKSHRTIVDFYNAHEPRARGYEVTYEDSWCAVFGSTVALKSGMLGWIPLECCCEQQIQLFSQQGDWVETDWYLPHPGDYIFYDWNSTGKGDCTGWSDHVGIVVNTFGPVMKVIEGNKEDDVSYRYLFLNDPSIRGFGVPDYERYCASAK